MRYIYIYRLQILTYEFYRTDIQTFIDAKQIPQCILTLPPVSLLYRRVGKAQASLRIRADAYRMHKLLK